MICPNCDRGFVQDLNELDGSMNPFDYFGVDYRGNRNDQFGIIDALSALIRQQMEGRSHEFDLHGRPSVPMENGLGFGLERLLLLPWQLPVNITENRGIEIIFSGGAGVGMRHANIGNYARGSGFNDLIEQLTRNDGRGSPPASQSAIDAMPTVKINQRHLRGDSHCPVCKEKFELGTEAREMPCCYVRDPVIITMCKVEISILVVVQEVMVMPLLDVNQTFLNDNHVSFVVSGHVVTSVTCIV
ncbi:hypothetical protein C4D60_Mb08t15530 [Musa balbisiana]|uniref:Uncharacterized protein n=1 Tax=Musa balbisiana TaxID=52838 RepID=A0A4S8K415_MUSBA|nr:hypothetical protein C4D60_Mb08t15530 [Musa balbisiana]